MLIQMAVAERYRRTGIGIAYWFICVVLVLLGSNVMILVVKVGIKLVKRGKALKAKKGWSFKTKRAW